MYVEKRREKQKRPRGYIVLLAVVLRGMNSWLPDFSIETLKTFLLILMFRKHTGEAKTY
jgi:hypothetical protein